MEPYKLEILTEIEEILSNIDNRLDFKIIEDSAFEFNLLDDNNCGYRVNYNFIRKRMRRESLLESNRNIGEDEEVTTVCIVKPEKYIFISNELADVPLLHAMGMNYIACHNDSVLIDHTNELNSTSLILTVKNQEGINAIHNIFDVETPIINVDFSMLCETYVSGDSLLELSAKLQETDKQGFDEINRFLYAEAKKYTDTSDNKKININETTDTLESIETHTRPKSESTIRAEIQTTLPISKLKADKKYQSRVDEDIFTIEDLAQAYTNKEKIPPIDVVKIDADTYIIVDGHHRYAGAKEAGIEDVTCHIIEGTEYDALVLSLSANANNKALKRTNADKRKAVLTALDHEEFKNYSNREIASLCKVSSTMVDKIVREHQNLNDDNLITANVCTQTGTSEEDEREIGADNSVYSPGLEIGTEKSSTSTPQTKSSIFKESLKNTHISLSVTFNNKPQNEESVQGLLTDLQNVINTYETDFKEVI